MLNSKLTELRVSAMQDSEHQALKKTICKGSQITNLSWQTSVNHTGQLGTTLQ